MSVVELVQRLLSLPTDAPLDWVRVRNDISEQYTQTSIAEREVLLTTYKVVMDHVERNISPADLEAFRTARRQDYNRLLISECIVGDGDVSPEALDTVTRREVAAGRMAPDDELRRLAVLGPGGLAAEQATEQNPVPKAKGWRRLFARH